ncbi:MAG: hypothetical protein P8M25_11385, partial [Paracoccaceae bacterium]|nr:hypothetical protein [Paracoccaceae bacterium]
QYRSSHRSCIEIILVAVGYGHLCTALIQLTWDVTAGFRGWRKQQRLVAGAGWATKVGPAEASNRSGPERKLPQSHRVDQFPR